MICLTVLKKNHIEFSIALFFFFALFPSISFLLVAASDCLLKEEKRQNLQITEGYVEVAEPFFPRTILFCFVYTY